MNAKRRLRFSLRTMLLLVLVVALASYWLRPERLDRSYFPIGVGYKWVYASAGEDVVFEVVRVEEVGEVECFVVDRTIGEHKIEFYVQVTDRGVLIHQVGDERYQPPYRQFAFGAKERDRWEWEGTIGREPNWYSCTIHGRQEVTTPLGEWDTFWVDQSSRVGTDFYLARGVGVVRIKSKSRDKHDPPPEEGEPYSFDWRLKEFTKP